MRLPSEAFPLTAVRIRRENKIVDALAHCDEGVDLLASLVAMTVADHAKEKDLTALPVKQP